MQVHQTTLQELIQGERQFRVPLFQRPYTWGKINHSRLWDDILDQYERLGQQNGRVIAGTADSGHFMGSLVLAPVDVAVSERVKPALVVDGQQRLTTLLLLLCALRDVRKIRDPQMEDYYNEIYLINRWSRDLSRYRLVPTQADREHFFACVDRGPVGGAEDGIGAAYRFFLGKLGEDESLDLERLTTAITKRLVFVDITTGPEDNPHRIFESLNATGVELTQSDLLRNHFFMLLPTRADAVYQEVWRPIEQRLGAENMEGLARVDLQRFGDEVAVDDVYRLHQQRIAALKDDEAKIEQRIRDYALRGMHYLRLVDPATEPDPVSRDRLEFLRRWGAQTTFPLLMHLYDLREQGRCSVEEFQQALGNIESFIVRRLFTGVSSRPLNRIFIQVIRQMNPAEPVPDALRRVFSQERLYWATDDELRAAIRRRNFYFSGRSDQKVLVLRRIEESFGDPEMVDFSKANLTIEHVLPQTMSEEWRQHLIGLGQDPEMVHAELVHTLGNLTLTAYNGVLSNNPFDRKRQILQESNLRLNRALREREQWGKDEIYARADELAEIACRIWPGPLPGSRGALGGFDWSLIDSAVGSIPAGRWTTYGDLAELGGTSAIAVGQHLVGTARLVTAYRVLGADGRPRPDFSWGDPSDQRDVREVLAADGVRFDQSGAADPGQRLRADDLRALVDATDEPLDTEWDAALIDRAVRESGPAMRQFLSVLVERAGEPVAISELAAAMSVGSRYIPGMLAAFRVRCRNRYKRSTWPFSVEARDWTYFYELSPETAELVRAALEVAVAL